MVPIMVLRPAPRSIKGISAVWGARAVSTGLPTFVLSCSILLPRSRALAAVAQEIVFFEFGMHAGGDSTWAVTEVGPARVKAGGVGAVEDGVER